MSIRPGVTSLPVASMVLAARAAGMSFSTASIAPQRMPMSRLPRSDWLGSSTSPPLMTRSNLSFGPIAALALPVSAAAPADPVSLRKLRRENPVMANAPPKVVFYGAMMRCPHGLGKPPADGRAPTATAAELLPEQSRGQRWRGRPVMPIRRRARQKITVLRTADGRLVPPAVRGELSEHLFRKLLQFHRNVALHRSFSPHK